MRIRSQLLQSAGQFLIDAARAEEYLVLQETCVAHNPHTTPMASESMIFGQTPPLASLVLPISTDGAQIGLLDRIWLIILVEQHTFRTPAQWAHASLGDLTVTRHS